jgi:cytosine/adenosine deaminase-related metal-dependent hydrolase
MDLLVTDAVTVNEDANRTIPDRCAAALRGDRIPAAGPTAMLKAADPDLPACGKAITPGFTNAHSQAIQTVPRATVEEWSGNALSWRHVPGVLHHVGA